MKFSQKLTLLFVVFALLFSLARAQDNTTINSLQSDAKALQFQISDNFNLSSFSGTVISYKWQLSDTRAKRIGLSLDNSYNWSDLPDSDNDQKASGLYSNLGIEYTWMNYLKPASEIKFFYGYGPNIVLGFTKNLQEESDRKIISQEIFYGIAGIGYVGVEWFFHSSMSLHAEYRASTQISHRNRKQTIKIPGMEEETSIKNSSIGFGGDGVKFGLSIYF